MNSRVIVNKLLEGGIPDDIGDPMAYIVGATKKETFQTPHPWMRSLRKFGFKGIRHQTYFSAERDVKIKSGETLRLVASGYDPDYPPHRNKVGISVYNHAYSEWSLYGTRPLALGELRRAARDIIQTLEQTEVKVEDSAVRGAYGRALTTAVRVALRRYQHN